MPLSKELEEKELFFLKNASCRKVFGWSILEDSLRTTKYMLMNVSTLCQEGKLSCIFGRYRTKVHANFDDIRHFSAQARFT